jgi:hypothetical protein
MIERASKSKVFTYDEALVEGQRILNNLNLESPRRAKNAQMSFFCEKR